MKKYYKKIMLTDVDKIMNAIRVGDNKYVPLINTLIQVINKEYSSLDELTQKDLDHSRIFLYKNLNHLLKVLKQNNFDKSNIMSIMTYNCNHECKNEYLQEELEKVTVQCKTNKKKELEISLFFGVKER